MSRIVEVKDLHDGDMFELENGSAYMTTSGVGSEGAHRVRVLCAHAPDSSTFDPPLVDLPSAQKVRLLSGREADAHRLHDGYVEKAFRVEMDRRNSAMMRTVGENSEREAKAQHQRDLASQPWWKKLLPRREA
jgi:hypothetical protein